MNDEVFGDLSCIKMDDFTQSARDLAEVIGIPAVLRVLKHFAGHDNVYVPLNVNEECELAHVIGVSAFKKLVGECGGTSVKINREHSVLRLLEQRRIVDMRLRGTKTQEVAKKFGITSRGVQKILKRWRDERRFTSL